MLGDDSKPHGNDVRERKNHFETSQSDAFAASGFRLAPDIFVLTAESGFNSSTSSKVEINDPSGLTIAT